MVLYGKDVLDFVDNLQKNNKRKKTIPKIIHYIWIGPNKKSTLIKKCIQSWEDHCPDYTILQWDESNYDCNKIEFIAKAYEHKKWAYVTDYARLDLINEYGGFYFDTDVELIQGLDDLLKYKTVFALSYASKNTLTVANGIGFASIPYTKILKDLMNLYDDIKFNAHDMSKIICNIIQHDIYKKLLVNFNNFSSIQTTRSGVTFLPPEYFGCKFWDDLCIHNLTMKTKGIHHFAASWKTDIERFDWILQRHHKSRSK